ncbi:MAG TPA: hypothetical protein ENG48_12490 [Candidatus Atribacteria bacterium]|nr:hypothetical protein [Candidatus Atribacteria bacterium]
MIDIKELTTILARKRKLINVTPHKLNMVDPDGTEWVLPPDFTVSVNVKSDNLGTRNGVRLIKPRYDQAGSEDVREVLKILVNAGFTVIGSQMTARTYKGLVVYGVPPAGHIRGSKKVIRSDVFSTEEEF